MILSKLKRWIAQRRQKRNNRVTSDFTYTELGNWTTSDLTYYNAPETHQKILKTVFDFLKTYPQPETLPGDFADSYVEKLMNNEAIDLAVPARRRGLETVERYEVYAKAKIVEIEERLKEVETVVDLNNERMKVLEGENREYLKRINGNMNNTKEETLNES